MSIKEPAADILSDFERIMNQGRAAGRGSEATTVGAKQTPARINVDPDKAKNGLGQLVLAIINLLHELLEKQAIRRLDDGSLSDEEIERLGLALMGQAEEIERLRKEFNLEEDDLNLDLGPLGKLL